ncbi:MAG: hypothetical protein GF347_00725 [Candidatus Moranbacteria bacterium]|nr:hypothetical protein [Candidatus Moranbacteria bacterium]
MLTNRQEKILEKVIREYTKNAEPIGSQYLLSKYDFAISGATMRSELAALEKMGLLYQPYTSSGRIPTDKGYRFYVNDLMKRRMLTRNEQMKLHEEHLKLKAQNRRLARTTAKLLAAFSKNLAISGLIEDDEYFQAGIKSLLSQPDFHAIDEICKIVEVLDYLDDNIENLIKKTREGRTETLIGRENPLMDSEDCSLVVSRCRLSNRKNVLIAIMGPKRMEYAKNISLINYVSKLLKE